MNVTDKEIKYSQLQINFEDSLQEDSAEHKNNAGVYASLKITENNITNGFVVKDRLLEKMMNKENVRVALKQSVMDGSFRPNPARRVEILKKDGMKKRKLGIIMLNELDKVLEQRGLRFARYADDLMIYCKSKRSAMRIMENTVTFVEKKLFLKVNREKTKVDLAWKLKFLGFSFYKSKGEARVRIHPKSIAKMKAKVKLLTGRSFGISNEERPIKLRRYSMGWINYFKIADIKSLLKRVDEWMRRRIRMIYWKQWKKVRTKFSQLISLGIEKSKAWEFANTRKGYWRISNSPILSRSLTNAVLKKRNYIFFSDYYSHVNS